MPLLKQTISIPFDKGMDTKTDEKLVMPGKLLLLENGTFVKGRKIKKRNGTVSLTKHILGQTSPDLTDGDGIASFNDELIAFADDKLYSFSDTNQSWINKGDLTSAIVEQTGVLRNNYQQTQVDLCHNSGITLYAWKDSRGGVRASVLDETTGAQIQSDVLISATAELPKCHAIAGFLYIFYKDVGNLAWVRLSVGAPQTFSSPANLKTDLHTTEGWFDVVNFGTRMVMTYHKNDTTVHIFFMNSSAVDSPMGSPVEITIAERAKNCLTIFNLDDLYIFVGYHNNTSGLRVVGRDANFVSLFATATGDADTTNNFVNITASKSTSAIVKFYYEQQNSTESHKTLVKNFTIQTNGTLTGAAVFKRSVGLATKAFAVGGKSYVNFVHDSIQQATFFTCTDTGKIFTRMLMFRAGGLIGVPKLGACAAVSTTECLFATSVKNKIEVEDNVAFTTKGVNKTSLVFDDDPAFRGKKLGENLHVVGGMLFDYDGLNIVEHGFHLFPENVLADVNRFYVVKKQDGTGGLPEISHMVFPHGDKITGGQYWTLNSTTTGYYVWYTKDGVGVDPAVGGRTAVAVAILSTDNADSVATKTKTALDAIGGAPFITTRTNNGLVITNAANGSVTDTANVDMGTCPISISVTTQGTASAAETTSIVCPAASLLTAGEYFLLNSANDARQYYVWIDKDSTGADPMVADFIGIKWSISTGNTATQVATALANSLEVLDDFVASSATATVTVSNSANGVTTDAVNVNVGGGSIANGEYQYSVIYQWTDSKGQIHRSAPSTPVTALLAGFNNNDGKVTLVIPTLRLTEKVNVIIHVFRTENAQLIFYRRTSVTSPKFNDTTTDFVVYTDSVNDAGIIAGEILYTNGGKLPNIAPPSCKIATVHNNRLWLITDEENTVSYSKTHTYLEGAGFSSFFKRKIDPEGGGLTNLASLDNNLIIFKRTRIRAISGRGPNDSGGENDLSNDFLITADVGNIQVNSVVSYDGGLVFKSDKGIYLLDRSLRVSYIGAPVEAYNSLEITSAVLVEGVNQIRFTTSNSVCLVWDYYFNEWSVFTNYTAVDAVVHNGIYYFMTADGTVKKEVPSPFTDDGAKITMRLKTAWLKVNSIQGFQRVYWASILGEFLSDHKIQVDIAYDYEQVVSFSRLWNPVGVINTTVYGSGTPYGFDSTYGGSADNVYQFRGRMPRQKCESIQFTIQDIMGDTFEESFSLSDLALVIGLKGGIKRLKAGKTV